ncbi:MAG: hypothetical protein OXQ28_10850 [Acidobacteriota bacterium]|nr:hypothetical protein [Acidobacteriota bacterium]
MTARAGHSSRTTPEPAASASAVAVDAERDIEKALVAGRDMQLEGLLHDAGEAYVGDWISPLYGMVDPVVQGLKERIQETVFTAADLPGRSTLRSRPVRIVDRLLARYESESSCGYGRGGARPPPPQGAPPPPDQPPKNPTKTKPPPAAAINAIKDIGSPSDRYPEQEHIRWCFLHKCKQLLPDDAPLRRTLEEAKHEYRTASTGTTP